MTGKQRLRILYDELLVDKTHTFDMFCWMQINSNQDIENNYCGTACCAFGLACTIPALQKQGLSFAETYSDKPIRNLIPQYGRYSGMTAAAKFFSIHMATAIRLFSPESYFHSPTREDVCARIKEVLEVAY
jgi:hypothetical protein